MINTKQIETKEHTDGRKDVHIAVHKLDIEDQDTDTIVAKKAIENQVFARLADQKVLVIILHKPTNREAHHVVQPQNVRTFAEAAVREFLKLPDG